MNKIEAFFESVMNRAGMMTWLGTASLALFQVVTTHHIPPESDLLGLVIGLGLVLAPDNGVTKAQLQKTITDVQAAITTKTPGAFAQAVEDVAAVGVSATTSTKPPTTK